MHELSLAAAIVEIGARHAAGRRVTRVYVQVGHLRQVVPAALSFAFEIVAQGTPLEGAGLELESIPATGACRGCRAMTRLETFPLRCGACGGSDLRIVTGEELLVESLELEEAEHAPSGG